MMCERMDIDVWEVIDAAATKPFGFMPFYRGPVSAATASRSTRCTSRGRPAERLQGAVHQLASEVNGAMPRHVVRRTMDALNGQRKPLNGARVLVLGVTYKRDVGGPPREPRAGNPGPPAAAAPWWATTTRSAPSLTPGR